MPKVTYNSTKGLIVESGDASFSFAQAHEMIPPGEEINLTSGHGAETSGNHNGYVSLTIPAANRNLTLEDGIAIGQEKYIIITSNGGGDLTLLNSDASSTGGAISSGAAAANYVHLCVWNGAKWQRLS